MANINIKDSSLMTQVEFWLALSAAKLQREGESKETYARRLAEYSEVRAKRTDKSLLREWAAHKFLYRLGLWKSRTISVDLNYPQKWYISLAYGIFGRVALVFVK